MAEKPDLDQIKHQIVDYMNQTLLASLTLCSEQGPQSFMVVFGNDKSGTIYICVRRDSRILQLVERKARVSMLISREEELLEDICSLAVSGSVQLLPDQNSQESLFGFDVLGHKSPLIGGIPAAGELDQYRILRLTPRELRFQQYRDYVEGRPEIILRRA